MKTEWTDTPEGLLRNAQDRLGYTNEQIARRLGRSGRAWARWRADDRVPTSMLPALAHALELPELLGLFDAQVSQNGHVAAPDEDLRQRAGELQREIEQALPLLQRALEQARRLAG